MVHAMLIGLTAVAAMVQTPETLAPGTVAVEPMAADGAPAAVRQIFAEAVERALSDARFMALPATSRSRYVARIKLTRTARGAVTSDEKEPRAAGGVGNWGAAVGVTLPSDKRQLRGLIVTELEVEIVRRDGTGPAWRGRALTAQAEGTRADAPAVLAPKLAAAAIRGFPAQQTEAASIP
ncbi:hypothetical protein [Sphingomonas sp. LT1P40]|uniref:hypothetical protein n=1 Tax=Alteristakelama amylovorans TaxID=3096166 RepID=UPI002FC68159